MDHFLWWRDGIIYQIYPRSFADSNHDGLGDLPGITGRLDYLAELGVDAIWLSPFYPTPDKDFGYDISNYMDVDPRFGTLRDFDELAAAAHQRNIRVVLDLVLNHTSDQHPRFSESRTSRHNPKADWYLWQDSIPNNWQAVFGGKAWTYARERGQYYYHMFLAEQPDVNWRNPEVRKAQLDVARFWLARGADGFRLDVFNAYFKDDQFRSNPFKLGLRAFDRQRHMYDVDRPEMIPLLQELRGILDSYPERYAVGETFLANPQKLRDYCGTDRLHAAFNFDFAAAPFDAARLLKPILDWEQMKSDHDIWPNYVLSNHDLPRTATRYGEGEEDARLKVIMALLLTQRGTPFLYYGEELGLRDIPLKRSEILDPPGKKYWPFFKGRDGCRAPMQWSAEPYAGFSTVKPWLPVHPDYRQRNVESQRGDRNSMFNFTRALIRLRKDHAALRRGDFTILTPQPRGGLAYLRKGTDESILVALNFKDRPLRFEFPENILAHSWDLLFSTQRGEAIKFAGNKLELAPHEVCLLKSS